MTQSTGTQFTEESDFYNEPFSKPPPSDLHTVDEFSMLRARIDEQSSLIMILKQRADDAVDKANASIRRDEEKSTRIVALTERIEEESKKCLMLETRFFELASNHEEMIKIKDDYKNTNERLRSENIRLRRENEQLFSQKLISLNEENDSLRQFNETIVREVKKLEHLNMKLEELLRESKDRHLQEKVELTNKYNDELKIAEKDLKDARDTVKAMTKNIKDLTDRIQELENQNSADKEKLAKEKEELLSLVMERGRIIQEKNSENKGLHLQNSELQKQLHISKERYQNDTDKCDADTRVRRLNEQLNRLQTKYDTFVKQHEAFKRHTANMLDSERLLNNQLASYPTTATKLPNIHQNLPLSGNLYTLEKKY